MRIDSYISELLYRYNCVIVPNFGGFITNEISAKINSTTHTFYPPTKQISFNRYLQNNNGLLANYIATVNNISFSKALGIIEENVEKWNQSLQNEALELEKIGTLSLNTEGNILFEPLVSENYLTNSFGLSSCTVPLVNRPLANRPLANRPKVVKKPVIVLDPVLSDDVSRRKMPVFLKVAASAAILFAIGSFTWNNYNQKQYQEQLITEQLQQKEVNQKIQEATFVIQNPLPTITLNITKEVNQYHIIAGAFRNPINANNKVQQLISSGFDAQILGINKWGLTQVSFASFNSKIEARTQLKQIKKSISSDAWLLIQEF
ncbi:MAG: SPOR domain-containing protein [Flavobacteriaceae bacterium]|nr:SPOR domain-containing protein [Flavobacteriaceae bacterium]